MRIECPNCRQQYDVGYEYLGRKVECAKCGKKFLVERKDIIRSTEKKEIPTGAPVYPRQQEKQSSNVFKVYFLDNLIGLPYCYGRARSSEYWGFVFFSSLISVVLGFIFLMIDAFMLRQVFYRGEISTISVMLTCLLSIIWGVYTALVVLIKFFIQARRFHDIGKSAWWLLLNLYPIAGWILVLRFLVTDSQAEDNQWGPNPKKG